MEILWKYRGYQMSYIWDYENLVKHRVNRMVNAIDRRNKEYLLERLMPFTEN